MDPLPSSIINFAELSKTVTEKYKNLSVALVNDHVIRMSIMTEPYFWHLHPNSDESFLVMEGILYIDLDDQTIELSSGELFTVPANMNHRTRPKTDRTVNISFERKDMETIQTNHSL